MVANRLPVDLEKLPDGTERWKRSPGGLVTALEPMLRSREGAWVGWPGARRRRRRAARRGRAAAAPGAPVGRGGRGLLRGLLQRHALAALPRRGRPAGVPPALVAGLRTGQPALRRGGGRGGGEGRHGLDPGLPAAAAARRAPQAAPRPADRLLPAHPVPAHRAVHAAAVAHADRRGAARRRPGRLPHPRRRPQLPLARHAHRRRERGARAQRGRHGRPHGQARRVPHLDRLGRARQALPHAGGAGAREADPSRPR